MIGPTLQAWARRYNLNVLTVAGIVAAPLLIPPAYLALLYWPSTRGLARASLSEGHIVESLSAILLIGAGLFGLWICKRLAASGAPAWASGFYAIYSIGLFFTGMEEISWGQTIFGFATPESWEAINVQGETNLHNLAGVQGIRDHIRLSFAIGGAIGCALSFVPKLRLISAPMMLAPWFAVIGFWTTLEIVVPRTAEYYFVADSIAELTELLVATSGFLYLWLNRRRLVASDQLS